MKSLNVPQQMWLQSFIASRIMSEAHAKALHKAAVTGCSMTFKASEYDDFFSKIAKAVQIVGLEIRRTVDETKGTHVVGLVNTKGDEIAQLATTLSPHEMTFVKKLIEGIVKAPYESFCLGSKDADTIAGKLSPAIPATKAEAICSKLVKQGWLRLSKAGRFSLTPRILMELQTYLQNTYEDKVLFCTACEELLTNGSSCTNLECDVRVHRHCLLKWERSLKGNDQGQKVCSHCSMPWETAPVGEAVMSSQYVSLRSARGARARQRARDEGEEEDDEEEEEFEDQGDDEEAEEADDVEEQPERGAGSRKRRSNGDTHPKVEDEEDELDEEAVRPRRRTRRS